MKTLLVYLSVAFSLTTIQVNAQKQLLKTAVEKINSYESITYQQVNRQKSPFTEEWSTIIYKAVASRNPQPDSIELFDYADSRGYRTVYNGNKVTALDLNNKTYETKRNSLRKSFANPYHWARLFEKMLALPIDQITTLPDTVINQVHCFHLKRTLSNLPANKDITDLYLHKKTYLPVLVRELLQGRMGKGDEVDVKITTMISEYAYTNYRTNVKGLNIAAFTIPANYNTEKKIPMLAAGSKAPDWILQNSNGTTLSGDRLKGKIVLLDFSFNECGACMFSIPVLNKLHEKYKDSNVEIATINTSNTKESVIKFARKNDIKYPILLNGSRVSKSFQVSAYPAFYVIDKQGNIAASFEGYNKTLESSLTNIIDKLK